jgi:hypothetical protein
LDKVDRAVDAVSTLRHVDLSEIPSVSADVHGEVRVLSFIGTGSTAVPDTYYNAKQALAYKVEPIVLAGGHLDLRFGNEAWDKIKEYLNIQLGYETDRAFESGGTIASVGPLSQELGITGVAADVIDGAVSFFGVGIEGEYATFTNGRVQEQDVATGNVLSDAPLQFTRKRVEATFDLSEHFDLPWAHWGTREGRLHDGSSAWILRAVYYDLTLPRIAYLTQSDAQGNDIVVAESAPQNIDVVFGAAGGSYRWSIVSGRSGFLTTEFTLLFGGGNVNFTMPASTSSPQSSSNSVALSEGTFAMVSRVGVRGEVRLPLDCGYQSNIYFGGSLSAEQYYARASVPGSVSGTVGFSDAFWSALGYASFRFDYRPGGNGCVER